MSWPLPEDCPDCQGWLKDPRHGRYRQGCRECALRQIARGPAAFKAATTPDGADLEEAIAGALPKEDVRKAKAWVKRWMQRVKEAMCRI